MQTKREVEEKIRELELAKESVQFGGKEYKALIFEIRKLSKLWRTLPKAS